MNLYTLYSKRGTIRRVFYRYPATVENNVIVPVPAYLEDQQRDLDHREFQLAFDLDAERRKAALAQDAKDAKEMQRLLRMGIERAGDGQ